MCAASGRIDGAAGAAAAAEPNHVTYTTLIDVCGRAGHPNRALAFDRCARPRRPPRRGAAVAAGDAPAVATRGAQRVHLYGAGGCVRQTPQTGAGAAPFRHHDRPRTHRAQRGDLDGADRLRGQERRHRPGVSPVSAHAAGAMSTDRSHFHLAAACVQQVRSGGRGAAPVCGDARTGPAHRAARLCGAGARAASRQRLGGRVCHVPRDAAGVCVGGRGGGGGGRGGWSSWPGAPEFGAGGAGVSDAVGGVRRGRRAGHGV
eukprot:ctg_1037.g337